MCHTPDSNRMICDTQSLKLLGFFARGIRPAGPTISAENPNSRVRYGPRLDASSPLLRLLRTHKKTNPVAKPMPHY